MKPWHSRHYLGNNLRRVASCHSPPTGDDIDISHEISNICGVQIDHSQITNAQDNNLV